MAVFNTEMTVDVEEVRKLVESDEFINFLLSHTENLATAAFIMQSVFDKIKELTEEGFKEVYKEATSKGEETDGN